MALTDNALVQRVYQELAEKPMLRLGVWLVLALVAVFLLLAQSDRLASARASHAVEAGRLQTDTATLAQDWNHLLAAEREASQALTEKFWQAETAGRAQAQLQQALTNMSDSLKLQDLRIRWAASQAVPGLPGVWRIQAQLNTGYDRGNELRLIHAVADSPRKLVVDSMTLNRSSNRMEIILSAYFMGLEADVETEGG